MRTRWWMTVSLCAAALACDESSPPAPDSGMADASRDGGHDGGPTTTAPAETELPVLVPCPPGWREIDVGGVPACDPWPEGGRASCAAGTAHFPGTPGCAPLGSPCPSGDFAEGLPSEGVLYVRAGGSGDGSRGSPFGTIAGAIAAAAPGTIVAIAKGTYAETLVVRDAPLELRGACAAETIVTSAPGAARPTLFLSDVPDGRIRDLSIAPTSGQSAISTIRSTVTVESVAITGAQAAIDVSLGSVSARRVRMDDITGTAVGLFSEATATVQQAVIRGVTPSFVALSAGGQMVVEDAAIDHPVTRMEPTQLFECTTGCEMTVTRSAVSAVSALALISITGARVEIADSLFVGTGSAAPGTSGALAFEGSELVLRRSRFERASAGAIIAGDPGTSLTIADVIVRDVYGETSDDAFGRAVDVETGAAAALTRVLVERASETALLFTGTGATGSLEHVTVRDSTGNVAGQLGRALQVQLGARVTGGPFRSTRQREVGVLASGTGTTLSLHDAVLEDTLPRACAETTCAGYGGGTGVVSLDHAQLSLERFAIADNAFCGAQVAREGEMDLSDGEIHHNPIGVNVQVPGYDITRLSDRVWVHDNGRALDSESLPVPEP